MTFVRRVCTAERIAGKTVLEVGSYNVNGSARDVVVPLRPASYTGVDYRAQERYVDEVIAAEDLVTHSHGRKWDVIISTEMLEHVTDWRASIDSMKEVLAPGGLFILTARGPGFPLHAYPEDHWRFTTDDVAAFMSDYVTLYLSEDCETHPGFLYAGHKQPVNLLANPAPMVVEPAPEPIDNEEWHPDAGPVAFYHVAAIGHWREIVSEQFALLAKNGFPGKVHVGFIGEQHEDGFIRRVADSCGIQVEIQTFGFDLGQFEMPTLAWMHRYCQKCERRPVLYFHTKGCSKPSWVSAMWRWIMNAYSLAGWEEATSKLNIFNCSGFSWDGGGFPVSYFPGNFWWARSSFVAQLTQIPEYVNQFKACIATRNPRGFTERHAAECWINSRRNARPFIYGPEDSRLWDSSWWRGEERWNQIAYTRGR